RRPRTSAPRLAAREPGAPRRRIRRLRYDDRLARSPRAHSSVKRSSEVRMQNPRPEVIHLAREQLYELVWRKPVSTLAREFGISDVALAKWCKKLNVPRP